METLIAALSSIPIRLGFLLGVLCIIPALPAMLGKPPSGWKQTSVVYISVVVVAIGMAAGMTQVMSNGAL